MSARDKQLEEALHLILDTCQEVAHEVEDPTQACAEIEAAARKALNTQEGSGGS